MKIIDGKNAILGRLASYVAKESLKGEEIVILNSEQVIITGDKKDIKKNFDERRSRVGSSQKGPKLSKTSEMIIKRTIRGMLPNHRKGRGKETFKRIKCYVGVPKKFQEAKKISGRRQKLESLEKRNKFIQIKEISK